MKLAIQNFKVQEREFKKKMNYLSMGKLSHENRWTATNALLCNHTRYGLLPLLQSYPELIKPLIGLWYRMVQFALKIKGQLVNTTLNSDPKL